MKSRNQMIKKLSVTVFSMIALATLGLSQAAAYEKEDQGETIILPISTSTVMLIEEGEKTGFTPPVEVRSDSAPVEDKGYEKEAS